MGQQTDEGKDGGGLAFRGLQMECSPGGGDRIGGACIVYPRPSGNSKPHPYANTTKRPVIMGALIGTDGVRVAGVTAGNLILLDIGE